MHRLEGPHSDALQLCTSGPGPKRSMQSAIVCESAVREKSGHISRLFWAWYFGLRMRHVIFMDAPPFFIPLWLNRRFTCILSKHPGLSTRGSGTSRTVGELAMP